MSSMLTSLINLLIEHHEEQIRVFLLQNFIDYEFFILRSFEHEMRKNMSDFTHDIMINLHVAVIEINDETCKKIDKDDDDDVARKD